MCNTHKLPTRYCAAPYKLENKCNALKLLSAIEPVILKYYIEYGKWKCKYGNPGNGKTCRDEFGET